MSYVQNVCVCINIGDTIRMFFMCVYVYVHLHPFQSWRYGLDSEPWVLYTDNESWNTTSETNEGRYGD